VGCELVQHGLVVVSGLAAGVDAEVHGTVIACGGDTIAVIGTDLDRAYPRENGALQERIYREHLLVSPFAPGTPTRPANFPIRNRVMARLTVATVLVAAGEKSGTRHQVRECLALRRPVLVSRCTSGVSWVRDLLAAGRVAVWDHPSDLRALLAPCRQASPRGAAPTLLE
jgi:DNA processing protein